MPVSIPCRHCQNEIPQSVERCPHCAQPGIFWNVITADDADERAALENRYMAAKADASRRSADAMVQGFENAVANSTAVIARSEGEVLRLANSTRQLYASYYQLMEGGVRLPDGDEWDVVREIADTLLFPKYKKDMRFAALSLDGIGLTNYGSCSITLCDNMISHRASVLEENSVLFMKHHGIKANDPDLPKGFRAIWADRGRLCVAKLAVSIDSATGPDKYSSLLLKQGTSSTDDDFVEVHIWGPISALTIEKVTVTASKTRQKATIVKALKSKLAKHGVSVS